MAIRSIASLSLTFGLVSIPVKAYLATESSAASVPLRHPQLRRACHAPLGPPSRGQPSASNSSTMIVMMMASTPSPNASRRPFP